MLRSQLITKFSARLISALKSAGHVLNQGSDKIDVRRLAAHAGCSYQMARKYVLGKAFPEIEVVYKIANWLNVDPGWLLYGSSDHAKLQEPDVNSIYINLEMLRFVLFEGGHLFRRAGADHDSVVTQFLVDRIYDASHFEADADTVRQFIRRMIDAFFIQTVIQRNNDVKSCINQ